MIENSFYLDSELKEMGFRRIGTNVKISKYARFYDISKISVDDYSRIDDFCILSGEITIGKYCHISASTLIYGKMGVVIDDFSGLSPRCTVFSAMDDFSGEYLIGPTIPIELTNVSGGAVYIQKYCQIGAGTIVFPNIVIHEGTAVGAMSLVNNSLDSYSIFAGIPARKIKARLPNLKTFAESILCQKK